MPTTLQFPSLPDLATYSKKVAGKGFQINIQNLTLKCKLSEAEIALAQLQHQAIPVLKIKTGTQGFTPSLHRN